MVASGMGSSPRCGGSEIGLSSRCGQVRQATYAGVKMVNSTTHVVSGSKIGATFDLAVVLPGVQIQQQAAHVCTRRMSSFMAAFVCSS